MLFALQDLTPVGENTNVLWLDNKQIRKLIEVVSDVRTESVFRQSDVVTLDVQLGIAHRPALRRQQWRNY